MKLIFFVLLLPLSVQAQDLYTKDFWIRLTPPMRKMTAAFGVIKNNSDKAVKLVSASTPIASKIEIHTHEHKDGVMKMRKLDELVVSKKASVKLKPKSHHLMIFGLKKPLQANEIHPIKLKFNNGKVLTIKAQVK